MEDLLLLLADREAALERYRARLRALNEQVPSICSDFFCFRPIILFLRFSLAYDLVCPVEFLVKTRIFSL